MNSKSLESTLRTPNLVERAVSQRAVDGRKIEITRPQGQLRGCLVWANIMGMDEKEGRWEDAQKTEMLYPIADFV